VYHYETKYGRISTLSPMSVAEVEAQIALVSAAAENPITEGEEDYSHRLERANHETHTH
jgi:hypothetical protein